MAAERRAGVLGWRAAEVARREEGGEAGGGGAPFHVRSLVKWRSIHLAPSVYAAMSIAMPRWWPEKAISLMRWPYSSFSRLISSMQTSGKGTG